MNGTVYLICFAEPFKHARHYLGWTGNLKRRVERHKSGHGSRLMAAVNQAGIDWQVVRTWKRVDRNEERRLKNRGGHARLCPVCKARQA